MMHPKDAGSANPRLQCVCCGKWKRLHTRATRPPFGINQTFFGGCGYNSDNDHLANKGNDYDVCADCCEIECKRIAAERASAQING